MTPSPWMTPSHRLFILVAMAWLVYELAFGLVPGRKGRADLRGADRGSWRWMTGATVAGVVLSGAVARLRVGPLPGAGPLADAVGIALVGAGFALRRRAIAALGDAFTSRVAVGAGHRLVDAGLYGWVRHPAYLGDLVAFAGIAYGQGSLLSAAVLLGLAVPPLLYRVRVEEAALASALGPAWDAYAARVPALLPRPRRAPASPAPPPP